MIWQSSYFLQVPWPESKTAGLPTRHQALQHEGMTRHSTFSFQISGNDAACGTGNSWMEVQDVLPLLHGWMTR